MPRVRFVTSRKRCQVRGGSTSRRNMTLGVPSLSPHPSPGQETSRERMGVFCFPVAPCSPGDVCVACPGLCGGELGGDACFEALPSVPCTHSSSLCHGFWISHLVLLALCLFCPPFNRFSPPILLAVHQPRSTSFKEALSPEMGASFHCESCCAPCSSCLGPALPQNPLRVWLSGRWGGDWQGGTAE